MAKNQKINFQPLHDYVLIEPLEEETRTPSGILLPDNAKEKPQEGKVLAVGTGIDHEGKKVEVPVKIGDKVIYKKWGGNEVKVEGKELLLVKSEDIIALIN